MDGCIGLKGEVVAAELRSKWIVGLLKGWLRLRYGHRVVHVNQVLRQAQRFLVCLPSGREAGAFWTGGVLAHIKGRFPRCHLTVAAHRTLKGWVKKSPYIDEALFFDEKDHNFLLLPHGEIVEEIRGKGFDVAIDLSQRFNLMTAYLCWSSGAPLRVGFRTEDHYPLFNLAFFPGEGSSPQESSIRLIDFLGSLRG